MKPHDCFGVIVRVIGLLTFLIGLIWACMKTLTLLEFGGHRYPGMFSERDTVASLFGYAYPVIFLLIGYLFMRGANWITNRLYPLDKP